MNISPSETYVDIEPPKLIQGMGRNEALRATWQASKEFKKVGDIVRVEAIDLVVGYEFDLQTNNSPHAKAD